MGYLLLPGASKQRVYPHVRDEMKRCYFEAFPKYRTRRARAFLTVCFCWWTAQAFFGILKEAGLDKLLKVCRWLLPPWLWWKVRHWLGNA